MKSYSEYRALARQTLQDQWNNAAVAWFIIFLIIGAFSGASAFTGGNIWLTETLSGIQVAVSILLTLPLQYGLMVGLLNLGRAKSAHSASLDAPEAPFAPDATKAPAPFEAMLDNFKKDYSRYVQAGLLSALVEIGLGIITLFIGTVIMSYAYAMIPFLLNDYPELTPKEACRTSREMMRGHKWDLFVLDLTFIGWYLLSILTLGIGLLWLTPYNHAARAHFYDDLKSSVIVEE